MTMRLRLFALLGLWLLVACTGSPSTPVPEGFSVQFVLKSVPENLPLDRLDIRITVGDTGKAQALSVDLRTGVSTADVQAFPGEKYKLDFVLYSKGIEIGKGEAKGSFAKDMSITLEPVWNRDSVATVKARLDDRRVLPAYLPSAYAVARTGLGFNIELDSTAGITYRWWIRLGDSVIAEGDGRKLAWTPGDSLAGLNVSVKIHARSGDTIVERIIWDVTIIGKPAVRRLARMVTTRKPGDATGSTTLYRYTSLGRLDSAIVYDSTLVPARNPTAGSAYGYDGSGRLVKVHSWSATAGDLDSLLSWSQDDRLSSVEVSQAGAVLSDSMIYSGTVLASIKTYVSGSLVRELVRVTGKDSAFDAVTVDSIFARTGGKSTLDRVVRSGYKSGQLSEATVLIPKTETAPFRTEQFRYNALGALALRLLYSEGVSRTLELSETFRYDSLGLLRRSVVKDEIMGDTLRTLEYAYAPVAGKLAANAPLPDWHSHTLAAGFRLRPE